MVILIVVLPALSSDFFLEIILTPGAGSWKPDDVDCTVGQNSLQAPMQYMIFSIRVLREKLRILLNGVRLLLLEITLWPVLACLPSPEGIIEKVGQTRPSVVITEGR